MKLKSKFLVLLLAVVFVFTMFAMTACGDDEGGDEVSIKLSETSISLVEGGDHKDITATVKGTNKAAEWTVDDDTVVTIQYTGNTCRITPVGKGTAKVTAKAGGKTATCNVTVNPAPTPAVTITLDKTELNLKRGDEATEVTATLDGAEDDETVTWSLADGGNAVVTITPNGNTVSVLPIAVGTTTLTATLKGATKSVEITVTKDPVTLTLDKERVELKMGEEDDDTVKLTEIVTATATNNDEDVEWTIGSTKIATIEPSADGNTCTVTAVAVGKTTLTASVEGEYQTIFVEVAGEEGDVELSLSYIAGAIEDGDELELATEQEIKIDATVVGSLSAPTWTVDEDGKDVIEVVGIGNTIRLKALKEGEATLTAALGDASVSVSIKVWDTANVTLSDTELTLFNDADDEDYSKTVTATVTGKIKTVTWEIEEGDEYITIAADGNTLTVTAKAAGTAMIVAKLGDEIYEMIIVTVQNPVTLEIDQDELNLKVGAGNGTINVTATDGDDEYTYAVTGDDDCITIEQNGDVLTVTPVKEGTAIITVSYGGKEVTCTVTVTDIPVWEFSNTFTHGEAGGFIYHQGNSESITSDLTVDLDIKVNGVSAQANQVFVQNGNIQVQISGSRFDDVEITYVFKKDGEIVARASLSYKGEKEVVLDSATLSISEGEKDTVSITSVNGSSDLSGKTISWAIDDTDVATIPEGSNGASVEITAVAEGETTLTCTVDGIEKTCTIKVVKGDVVIVAKDYSDRIHTQLKNSAEYLLYFELESIKANQDHKDIVTAIDPAQTTVEVTINGGDPVNTFTFHRREWQGVDIYNLYINVNGGGQFDWDNNDYEFRFSLKNGKGVEIAYGICTEIAPADISIPAKADIELGEGGAEVTFEVNATGIGAANDALDDITWTLTGGDGYVSIPDGSTGATVTLTATKATTEDVEITLTATLVFGDKTFTKTCTVTVRAYGAKPTTPESDFELPFIQIYGAHYMKFDLSKAPSDFSFDYVTVNGEQRWTEVDQGAHALNIYVTGTPNSYDGEYKFEFYKAGVVVATVYFTYPVAA